MVVICSKRTPLSEWCQKEIEIFKGLHGEEKIIPVLIEGEPDEAFPSPLKEIKDRLRVAIQEMDIETQKELLLKLKQLKK